MAATERKISVEQRTTKEKQESMKIKVTIETVIDADELTDWPQVNPATAVIKCVYACLGGGADWPSKLEIKAEEVKE